MVTGGTKVALMVSTGIRVTKAIAECALSNSNCRRQTYVKYQYNDYNIPKEKRIF